MKIVAITLMRKGSKRFPDKCMADLCGKLLYMHTVEFALALGYPYFLAHDYENLLLPKGISEIKRDPMYAGDLHRTNEEIKSFGIDADYYIFLQATNPIRDIEETKTNIQHFLDHDYDYMFAAKKLQHGYYYRKYDFSTPKPVNFYLQNRTDNQERFGGVTKAGVFIETGSFYMFKKKQLEQSHFSITENFFIMQSSLPMVDINTKEDLKKAEEYLENKTNP